MINILAIMSITNSIRAKMIMYMNKLIKKKILHAQVDLSWKQPEFNAHLVDHYLINLYEIDPNTDKIDPETEIRMATISKSARISVLEPGTRRKKTNSELAKILLIR